MSQLEFLPINAVASKLDKDEIYTFIYGFALGLFFFLIYFVEFYGADIRKPQMISADPYLLIFSFLGLGLFFTFIIHIVYNLLGLPIFNSLTEKIKKEIANEPPRLDWCVNSKNLTDWANVLHVYQLSASALVILMFFPLFYYIFHSQDWDFCCAVWFYETVLGILVIVAMRYLRNEWSQYLKIIQLANFNLVKMFYNVDAYSAYQNQIVDWKTNNYFNGEALNIGGQGFRNIYEGMNRLISELNTVEEKKITDGAKKEITDGANSPP